MRQKEEDKVKVDPTYIPKTNDRQYNPLIATQATTGGGKSLYLDEFGALRARDLDMCKDPETKRILQNSVVVSIAYNAGSPFEKLVDNDPEAGSAMRALHRYCI